MSRAIKLGAEDINAVMEDIRKTLESAKLADGKFSFSTTIGKSEEKATVTFAPIAWLKMQMLIGDFQSEVGWYGVARRADGEGYAYCIDDILVYPQSVTGAYVDFDEAKVSKWLFDNREDERFSSIRMHGHSHVNMAVSPSTTDKNHYKTILDQLRPDGFYIFMIWNKSGQSYCEIYDMRHNIMFENGDVTMNIDGADNLGDFLADAKKQVERKTWTQYGNKPAEPKKEYASAWEIQKAATAESLKKKAESKKSSTLKRSGKSSASKSYGAWDDYDEGYYGGSLYDGCYGID